MLYKSYMMRFLLTKQLQYLVDLWHVAYFAIHYSVILEKLDAKTDLRCTVQTNEIKSLLYCLTHAHTHWKLCVLCLSPTLTLPIVLSLHWCCVLSCSDPVERAGLAGGWAGGKEGPHPWKLCGDAVASNGSIYWQVENLQRCMRLNSDVHSRALFLQIPEFSSASDDMLRVDYSWCTSTYIFGWQVDPVACASMFVCFSFEFTLVENPQEFQSCNYNMGLHL